MVSARNRQSLEGSWHPEHRAFLQLLRLAGDLLHEVELLLRPTGLTPSQFNVLRILRGAGPEGLACQKVAERMVTRDPDMTRLLDRLEARNLVVRSRQNSDRRVILTRITDGGARLLALLDTPVADLHTRQLAHLGESGLKTLSRLLEVAQGAQKGRSGTAGDLGHPTDP